VRNAKILIPNLIFSHFLHFPRMNLSERVAFGNRWLGIGDKDISRKETFFGLCQNYIKKRCGYEGM